MSSSPPKARKNVLIYYEIWTVNCGVCWKADRTFFVSLSVCLSLSLSLSLFLSLLFKMWHTCGPETRRWRQTSACTHFVMRLANLLNSVNISTSDMSLLLGQHDQSLFTLQYEQTITLWWEYHYVIKYYSLCFFHIIAPRNSTSNEKYEFFCCFFQRASESWTYYKLQE